MHLMSTTTTTTTMGEETSEMQEKLIKQDENVDENVNEEGKRNENTAPVIPSTTTSVNMTLNELIETYPSIVLFAIDIKSENEGQIAWMSIQSRDSSKFNQCIIHISPNDSIASSSVSTTPLETSSNKSSNSSNSDGNETKNELQNQESEEQQIVEEDQVLHVSNIQQALQKFDQYIYESFIRSKYKFCLAFSNAQDDLFHSEHGLFTITDRLGIRLAAHYRNYCDLSNTELTLDQVSSSQESDEAQLQQKSLQESQLAQLKSELAETKSVVERLTKMQKIFQIRHQYIVSLSHEKILKFKLSPNAPVWTGKIVSTTKPITTPVIRLRGLPWTCNEEDIAKFFEGCKFSSKSASRSASDQANTATTNGDHSEQAEEQALNGEHPSSSESQGSDDQQQQQQQIYSTEDESEVINEESKQLGDENILLVLNSHGRATGEAYVEFVSVAEAKLAFEKDRKNMKHRYIEIFASSKREMDHTRQMMEYELGALGDSTVVRMRGLPYRSSFADVEQFFEGLEIATFLKRFKNPNSAVVPQKKILVVTGPDGRSTGDAYVEFRDVSVVQEALKRNKEKIGNRYIELFRSTVAEMSAARQYSKIYAYQQQHQQQMYQVYPSYVPYASPDQYNYNNTQTASFSDHVVKLTSLPTDYDEKHIAEFFSELDIEIADQGIHLVFDENQASTGEAFIELFSEEDVNLAVKSLKISLASNNVAVSKSSASEMMIACGQEVPTETSQEPVYSEQPSEQQQQYESAQFQTYIDTQPRNYNNNYQPHHNHRGYNNYYRSANNYYHHSNNYVANGHHHNYYHQNYQQQQQQYHQQDVEQSEQQQPQVEDNEQVQATEEVMETSGDYSAEQQQHQQYQPHGHYRHNNYRNKRGGNGNHNPNRPRNNYRGPRYPQQQQQYAVSYDNSQAYNQRSRNYYHTGHYRQPNYYPTQEE